MKQRIPSIAFIAVLLGAPRAALAVDPEEVYQAALADFSAGNFTGACPKFAEARRMKPDSSAALQGLALCLEKAGRIASAWGKYRELSVELKANGDKARGEAAAKRADDLAKIMPTVTLDPAAPDTPGLIVRIDKDEVPRAMFGAKSNVDPGEHVIEATAPGYEVWRTTITIGAGDRRYVQVPALVKVVKQEPPAAPPPVPPPPPGWGAQRIAGVTVGGVGLAGLIVGGVFGGLAAKKNGEAKDACAADWSWCTRAGAALQGDARTLANGSNAAFAVGGAAVIAGIVLFATAPKGEAAKASARVSVAPMAGREVGGVVVRGGW